MTAVHKIFNSARELTDYLNVAGVAKENIVTVVYKNDEFVLIYYLK